MLFHCKQFDVLQSKEVFKITTDATLLGAFAWNDIFSIDDSSKVLEIGTGTGIISLMLAQRFLHISIHGIDNSTDASKLTAHNFNNSPFSDRLSCEKADFLSFENKFDHLVLNPPYFQNDTLSKSELNKTARHLKGMNYIDLIKRLLELIKVKGTIEMIHPFRYFDEIQSFLDSSNSSINRLIKIRHNSTSEVRNCITRIIKGEKQETDFQFFEIRNLDNSFSDQYIKLLRPFINV